MFDDWLKNRNEFVKSKPKPIVFKKFLSGSSMGFEEPNLSLSAPSEFDTLVLLPSIFDDYDLILAVSGPRVEYYLGYWNGGVV